MSREVKMGGGSQIGLLLAGDQSLADLLLGREEGGAILDGTLEEGIRTRHETTQKIAITRVDGSLSTLIAELERPSDLMPPDACDVIVLSGGQEITADQSFDRAAYREKMSRLFSLVRSKLDAHVIVFNASTVDPTESVHRIDPEAGDPFVVATQKLNLALVELSYSHGISIVDVDRLLAEFGTDVHVKGRLDYSPEAVVAVRDEFIRILEDIGFFHHRPLLQQVGNKQAEH